MSAKDLIDVITLFAHDHIGNLDARQGPLRERELCELFLFELVQNTQVHVISLEI